MADETISGKTFHSAVGVAEWRVLFAGAMAHWRTNSLREGARFAARISAAAEELGRDPDVDIRPRDVVVTTRRPDGTLDERDLALAQRISSIARDAGLESDPTVLQAMQIFVAQAPGVDVRPFFEAAFGYEDLYDSDAVDPNRRGIPFAFNPIARAGRGRTHIDVSVPADQAEARVRAVVAAGGRLVDDSHAPMWWTLASPDNHGVDIAAWADIDN
ncbi:VOC family protein [Microbacterium sp. ASV49]|uniref:Putative pterin-4-alpha-carbinolamine dehydratase n=1 Tax=Microbacterium candidum TaxID=3041922 RepID=A0ABT7MWT3_9MICO|nr:VOC family protein [Microbacterium sp. ASV49]MDL9978905.1 VOC family protein [Microbacterium sp. ASV49]